MGSSSQNSLATLIKRILCNIVSKHKGDFSIEKKAEDNGYAIYEIRIRREYGESLFNELKHCIEKERSNGGGARGL